MNIVALKNRNGGSVASYYSLNLHLIIMFHFLRARYYNQSSSFYYAPCNTLMYKSKGEPLTRFPFAYIHLIFNSAKTTQI